jgi:hypothetical protein
MGLLDRLFKKQSNDLKDQQDSWSNSKSQGQDSFGEQQERSIQEMDEVEIERMIDQLARDEYSQSDIELTRTDPLLLEAARLVVQTQQGSTSLIQRTLSIGYNRSGRIIDQLEEFGIVGPFLGDSARKVIFKNMTALENYLKANPDLKSKTELFYEKYKEKIELRKAEYFRVQEIENDRLEKEAIKQQMLERERKKRIHKEALKELVESGKIFNSYTNKNGIRESIPQDVMDKVWNRDGGKCVKCGAQENLEFDHIIPFSKGGATTYRNLQLLCKKCNLEKTNNIG